MIDVMIMFWIIIFIIFLVVNVGAESNVFGMIGGFWLLVLGLAILVSGVQIQTGATISDTAITYVYEDVVLPFSTYSYIWGIFMVSVSLYMILANGMKQWK